MATKKPVKKATTKKPAVKKPKAVKAVKKPAVKKPTVKKATVKATAKTKVKAVRAPSKKELAKQAEQEKLLATLKFTPRTYKISMWGYGGEKVMGTVSREAWDYCMENSVDISDIAWSDEDTVRDEMGFDVDKLPFYPGNWYDCDDMAHVNGVSRSAGTLQILDEKNETVFERALEDLDGGDDSPEWEIGDEVWVGMRKPGEIVFIGSSNEKGTFFEADINLKAPFDITKLTLYTDDVDGEEIVTGANYDGEDLDNWGGSTDGKSSDFSMHLVQEGGEWETYSPEEKDWGHPEFGSSPSDWERSPTFKFKKHKPVHVGYYSVVWRDFGTSSGSLYWNGTEFGDWEYGQFKSVSKVDTWYGFNWDTSSWDNQPTVPPDVYCDDKKCGWIGLGENRITDDDYNDHCPDCNGTEFSWIDYNPDTAAGRKNRDKYCPDWNAAKTPDQVFPYVLGTKEIKED